MSVWGRLFTAVRGSVNETAETIADSQTMRILDQQLRDAETALLKAQTDLAGLMGKAKLARDKVGDLQQKHGRDMAVLERAVEQGHDQLAQELADRIALLEGEIEREGGVLEALSRKEAELREAVVRIRQKIQAMKREIDTVKVTESVQKAQEAIVSHGAGAVSTLNNAAASLQRLKEKQAARAAQFDAANQLEEIQTGGDLDRRLADAGLLQGPGSGASVLARLKARSANPALGAPPATAALPMPSARVPEQDPST
ncbi:PspA/IM30 family protein [Chelatococcus reniformis]|uniref:Phage shock protein A n=1 Tax=Chelatococcus reniformis TaxID=1494448 RepID=A0A916XIQ2_9HYPH|nr:PspA/IM30 family protein [Chelatococcus reniformis]GGC74916.1 phage shock protein A [Chelatococcus reniformis]